MSSESYELLNGAAAECLVGKEFTNSFQVNSVSNWLNELLIFNRINDL